MNDLAVQALRNAAASSAMEGLPLEPRHMDMIHDILNGKITLQDYFKQLQEQELRSQSVSALDTSKVR